MRASFVLVVATAQALKPRRPRAVRVSMSPGEAMMRSCDGGTRRYATESGLLLGVAGQAFIGAGSLFGVIHNAVDDLGLAASDATLGASSLFVGWGLGAFLGGSLADKLGRKPVIGLSHGAAALAFAMLGAAPFQASTLFVASKALLGLACGIYNSPGYAAARKSLDARRGAALSLQENTAGETRCRRSSLQVHAFAREREPREPRRRSRDLVRGIRPRRRAPRRRTRDLGCLWRHVENGGVCALDVYFPSGPGVASAPRRIAPMASRGLRRSRGCAGRRDHRGQE